MYDFAVIILINILNFDFSLMGIFLHCYVAIIIMMTVIFNWMAISWSFHSVFQTSWSEPFPMEQLYWIDFILYDYKGKLLEKVEEIIVNIAYNKLGNQKWPMDGFRERLQPVPLDVKNQRGRLSMIPVSHTWCYYKCLKFFWGVIFHIQTTISYMVHLISLHCHAEGVHWIS